MVIIFMFLAVDNASVDHVLFHKMDAVTQSLIVTICCSRNKKTTTGVLLFLPNWLIIMSYSDMIHIQQ